MISNEKYSTYVKLLKDELVPAMGCTEPISIAYAVAKAKNVEVEEGDEATKGHVLIAFFDAFVEEKLVQPTIIYDYPVENSPLATFPDFAAIPNI